MFDDPNKALKKLQEQLLAAEEPEQDIFAPPPKEPEYEDYDPAEYGEEAPQEPVRTETRDIFEIFLLRKRRCQYLSLCVKHTKIRTGYVL